MCSVKRNELHHNFLKSVILRLDFQGVLESEMEKIVVCVKHLAKETGFSRYMEKILNQIGIAVPGEGATDAIEKTSKARFQKIYSFIDETRGFVLDLSNSFICLTVNATHYSPFEEYRDIIPAVADIYKANIDFYTVTRLGFRKINECLIEDKSLIKKYFRPEHFSYYDLMGSLNTIQSNHLNIFNYDKYHVNLITNITQGKSEGKTVYSVRLDTDAYLDRESDILPFLNDQEAQVEMNDLLFKIYLSLLTDSFIDLLASENDFDNTLMIGVERIG